METNAPLPTELHVIELGTRPLPDDCRDKLLKIIGKNADDKVAQEFLVGVANALGFCRVVAALEKRATTEVAVREELASLADTLRTFLKACDSLSREAWGLLATMLHQMSGTGPNYYAKSQLQSGFSQPNPDITEEADQSQWAGRAAAPAVQATEGAKALLSALNALVATFKPSEGNGVESGARLLANDLARLLRPLVPRKLTAYANGPFARVYRVCYAEAFDTFVAEDPPRDFRHFLGDAIAGTTPP